MAIPISDLFNENLRGVNQIYRALRRLKKFLDGDDFLAMVAMLNKQIVDTQRNILLAFSGGKTRFIFGDPHKFAEEFKSFVSKLGIAIVKADEAYNHPEVSKRYKDRILEESNAIANTLGFVEKRIATLEELLEKLDELVRQNDFEEIFGEKFD